MGMWRECQLAASAFVVASLLSSISTGAKDAHAVGTRMNAAYAGTSTRVGEQEKIKALLRGIPERGSVLGRGNAPVTLQYFADLECPFCRQFDLNALQALIHRYVRTGKLRIDFRAFETATRERETFLIQQVAALAAGRQDKLWYFVELFFREQGEEFTGYVTKSYLRGLAEQVPGLRLSQWEVDRSDRSLFGQVQNDERVANRAHLTGTPSFLIGRTGGKLRPAETSSLTDPGELEREVNHVLRR